MNQTIIVIIFLALAYWIIINMLKKRGILEKYNISAYGPLLMIRITKEQKLLDLFAKPKKFWRLFANIGIPLMFIGMIVMTFILIIPFIRGIPEPGKLHEPQNILLIPGLNEFIPFTWGLIALIITLVVHEFSHAILAKVESVKVKSMGVLLLTILPIGGFAELDEESLFGKKEKINNSKSIEDKVLLIDEKIQKTETNRISLNAKSRILVAGVMSNFVVAFFAFLLLFGIVLSGIGPVDNAIIMTVDEGSNSFEAGLRQNMVIIQINDKEIRSISDIVSYMKDVPPETSLEIHTSKNGELSIHNVKTIMDTNIKRDIQGIYVQSVIPNNPAENAGIKAGMYIIKIDGTPIQSPEDFRAIMQKTKPNQIISVDVLTHDNEVKQFDIELADRNGVGFLGISNRGGQYIESLGITLIEFPAEAHLNMLKNIPSNWHLIFAIPLIGIAQGGYTGFNEMLMQFYEPIGWAEPFGVGIFWIANILLWTGWINFTVGLFNCIPAIPFDGGHIFKGYFELFIKKITKNESTSQSIAGMVTGFISIFVLLSFVFMIFVPHIVHRF